MLSQIFKHIKSAHAVKRSATIPLKKSSESLLDGPVDGQPKASNAAAITADTSGDSGKPVTIPPSLSRLVDRTRACGNIRLEINYAHSWFPMVESYYRLTDGMLNKNTGPHPKLKMESKIRLGDYWYIVWFDLVGEVEIVDTSEGYMLVTHWRMGTEDSPEYGSQCESVIVHDQFEKQQEGSSNGR